MIANICEKYQISVNWLIKGRGSPNIDAFKLTMEQAYQIVDDYVESNGLDLTEEKYSKVMTVMYECLAENPETSSYLIDRIIDIMFYKEKSETVV